MLVLCKLTCEATCVASVPSTAMMRCCRGTLRRIAWIQRGDSVACQHSQWHVMQITRSHLSERSGGPVILQPRLADEFRVSADEFGNELFALCTGKVLIRTTVATCSECWVATPYRRIVEPSVPLKVQHATYDDACCLGDTIRSDRALLGSADRVSVRFLHLSLNTWLCLK